MRRARLRKSQRLRCGIVAIDGRSIHIPLGQPHHLAALEVDRGKNDQTHGRCTFALTLTTLRDSLPLPMGEGRGPLAERVGRVRARLRAMTAGIRENLRAARARKAGYVWAVNEHPE